MNVRERLMAMVVLGFITLAGGALMVSQFIWTPLRNRNKTIEALQDDIEKKRARLSQIQAELPKLDLWRRLSLPADVSLAQLEYEKYLRELLQQSGFDGSSTTVTPHQADSKTVPLMPGKKEPIYTRLTFTVKGNAELADVVDFLERFYRTSLLHQVKKLDIKRPLTGSPFASPLPGGEGPGGRGPGGGGRSDQRTNVLDIEMNIEALVLTGADKRKQLLPGMDSKLAGVDVLTGLCQGPTGFALMPWAVGPTGPLGPGILAAPSRQYASIAGKDIFFGPPVAEQIRVSVDATEFVFLTDITHTGAKAEAFLYDRYNNSKTRLRASAGFDSFRIRDSKGETLVQGKIVRIDDRDLIFRASVAQAGEKYYSMHVGQNLEEVLKRPLQASQLKELGLNSNSPKDK